MNVSPPTLLSIAITPPNPSFALGTTQALKATGTYSDGSTQDLTNTAIWNSASPNVATVSAQGLASSVATGSSVVTATFGSIAGSTSLSVIPATLVSIAITPPNPAFALGTTQALKATGTYTDGSTQDLTGTVAWSSASPNVATVNSQGLASSVATGSSIVTATFGAIAGSTTLTVTSAALVSIAVTPAIPTIAAGATQAFAASGTYTDGSTQDITDTVSWNSDTASVATISNQVGTQGIAKGLAAGTATISATSGSITGSTVLTVTSLTLISITVTPVAPSITVGTSQQFFATGTYSDGSTQVLTSATWSSDSTSIATITSSGLASAVSAGAVTIAATSGSINGSTTLTVTGAILVSISISPSAATIAAGTTQPFTATGLFSDGSTQDLTQVGYWTSSVPTVATVSDAYGSQGLASAIGAGVAIISVADGNVSGSATLTVNPAALTTITVNPANASIPLGTTQQFAAVGTYSDGSTQDITGIATWASSQASVAVVSNSPGSAGLATSAGEGSTTVSAASGQISGTAQLIVGLPTLVSLTVTPANASMPAGTTQQFAAAGTFSDGSTQDLTTSVTWSSSVPAFFGINAGGLGIAISPGSATVSAVSGTVSASTAITVTAPILVSIVISPTSAPIAVLGQQQYSATGTYSDGSTQLLTSTVNWNSSSTSIATINSAGLAAGRIAGLDVISASLGNVVASASLSVGQGTVSGPETVTCGSGFASKSQCTQAMVSCPGTADLLFTYGVKQGTGAGVIVIYNGAAGIIAGGTSYVTAFNGAGFTTVQVAWASNWQDTGLTNKNILTAACRPATVGQYLHSILYSSGGFGVLGGSAGAGAVGYWLSWYNGENLLDNVELASGPVYSDIEQGCEVPIANPVTIVPTNGTPWTDEPNYRGGPQNGLTTETGYICQPKSGSSSVTDAAWLSQSICSVRLDICVPADQYRWMGL